MEGTEQVRREAADRVDALIEKFGSEREEEARQLAEQRLRDEDERIRREADRRAELAQQSADDEVRAAADRARQEARSAASSTAPEWERTESFRDSGEDDSGPSPRRRRGGPGAGGYRTF